MPLEDFLVHQATIEVDSLEGQLPAADALGGVDRTEWHAIATGVPCLEAPYLSKKVTANDQIQDVTTARVYFGEDPLPGIGLSMKHRITVNGTTYRVMGIQDANKLGRLIRANCESAQQDG